MKRFLLLINLLVCFSANSQTTLERGDIMVLGVNANATCSSYDSNINSAIYLIAFKNISPNTIIDLTDNGYYRANPDRFGTTEGALRFIRKSTSSTITAGTVFTLLLSKFPQNAGGGLDTNNNANQTIYTNRLNSNNSEWNVSLLNNSTSDPTIELNYNAGNDQIFLLQGGANPPNPWNRIGSQNASYNGKFLYGFNSKRNWRREPSSNPSQESALPGYELLDLDLVLHNLRSYHFSPHQGGFSRSYYSGPRTPTSKNQWLIRILNSRNWTIQADCSLFASNIDTTTLPVIEELGNQAVCKDDELFINVDYETLSSTNSIQTQYEWFELENPGNSGGISVGTTRQLTVPTGTVGTKYYYCMITYRLQWTNSGPSSPAALDESFNRVASGYYEVTVNPNPITSPVTPL